MALRRKYGITPGTHIAIEVDEDNRHARLTHAPRREADNQRTPLEGEAGFAFHGESEFPTIPYGLAMALLRRINVT